jgi:acyl-CoA hydrolase
MNAISVKQSRTTRTSLVLPPDTNHLDTIFGGKVLAYIDEVAAIAAMRHSQKAVVTGSIDSVDFLHPVKKGDTIVLEAFVAWTGKSSMEVFVKVSSESFLTSFKQLTATSFLTMIAVDEKGKPTQVPQVIPETPFEIELYQTAAKRQQIRKERKKNFLQEMMN